MPEIVFSISVTTSVVWLEDCELFYDVRHGTLPGDLFITKFSLVGLMVKLSGSKIFIFSEKRCGNNPPAWDVNYTDMKWEREMHSSVYPDLNDTKLTGAILLKMMMRRQEISINLIFKTNLFRNIRFRWSRRHRIGSLLHI